MQFTKEQQLRGKPEKKSAKMQSMTPKRRDLEAEKKSCYKRIDSSRPPVCEGCGCRGALSHSHRFPQAYQNYKYIAVDESIDLYCMGFDNNCHGLYETSRIWVLKNGEDVMKYLMRTDYGFFMAKLTKMSQRIQEEQKKRWLAKSQGLVSVPKWATDMISEHLNISFEE